MQNKAAYTQNINVISFLYQDFTLAEGNLRVSLITKLLVIGKLA